MSRVDEDIEVNKEKIKIGFCVQIESYLEILDITFDELLKHIEENEKLFSNFPLSEFTNAIDRIKSDISFLFIIIEDKLQDEKFNICDYLLKYYG